jgi:hypothetical protein
LIRIGALMRATSLVLGVLALACEGLAYWGLRTEAGRSSFDEMAGILPLAAVPAGALLALSALAVWWCSRRAKRESL